MLGSLGMYLLVCAPQRNALLVSSLVHVGFPDFPLHFNLSILYLG